MPISDLKSEPMMSHLIATLESGHSIGHYGRLVFAMVARHFLDSDELLDYLCKDPECQQEQMQALVQQVEARGYNPPKRERILEWMKRQNFPICPNPDDPNQCKVYRNLDLPKDVYDSIAQYYGAAEAA
jgi:hypothetical protein